MNSEPFFTKFSPDVIPYQRAVCDLIDDFDFSQGNLEVLLSGSYGCVKEDTLVETACGLIPICDIDQSSFVLGFDHSQNRFAFQQGSDAFPKGKDYFYRVIHEHGEFQAIADHRIATYRGDYLPVGNLFLGDTIFGSFPSRQSINPLDGSKYFVQGVLRYFHTLSSLIYHCSERIHQYDPQLRSKLNNVLNGFPLSDGALRSGLFFYNHKPLHAGDYLGLELIPGRISELSGHLSKSDFSRLLIHLVLDEANACVSSKFYERISQSHLHQQDLLSLVQDVHPKVLLSFLSRISTFLTSYSSMYYPNTPVKSKVLAIEKSKVKDWYWDVQIPNINNYVSSGALHHNSAKSILMAHLLVRHCVEHPRSRVCIARRSLPDLKKTIWKEVLEHMDEDFVEGKHYRINRGSHIIRFRNGSEIITATWADKRYKKFRSLKLSMLVIEEIVENDEEDEEAFKQLKARLRRLPHIKENILIAATNPDAPGHWVWKYFIEPNSNGSKHPYRYVFYSKTDQNPFLDGTYVRQLREDMSPKEARRYLDGEWIELKGEVIYYEYESEKQYLKTVPYKINPHYPIGMTFDFNIGDGKPMSAILFQFIGDVFHFFGETVIHGARTAQMIEDMDGRDLLDPEREYLVTGDAAGKHRDTRSTRSDYDIITTELSQRNLRCIYGVPPSNPPLRTRHNRVNAYCKNSLGHVRLYIYKGCSVADEGMRLVKLKEGGNYIEDDSKAYQHITTAIGYAIVFSINALNEKHQGTVLF